MALGGNGDLVLGATVRTAPDAADSNGSRLILWRIDQGGKVISETEIEQPAAREKTDTPARTATIKDLVVGEDGNIVVLVDFNANRPSLVSISPTGRRLNARALTRADRPVSLVKIIRTSGGRFLLIGQDSLDTLAIKTDAAGTVLWEKKNDRGRMEIVHRWSGRRRRRRRPRGELGQLRRAPRRTLRRVG